MKLHIANLGAVKEATIDLGKKLIVFCGPNGTGKTWTAYAIGGLLDAELLVTTFYLNRDMSPLIASGEMEISISPEAILDTLETQLEKFPSRIFSIFPVTLEKQDILFKLFKVSVQIDGRDFIEQYILQEKEINITILGYPISVRKNAGSTKLQLRCHKAEARVPFVDASVSAYFLGGIAYSLATSIPRSTMILPVERNSIFTFNKELSLQKTVFYDILKQRSRESSFFKDAMDYVIHSASRYPQAVRDALYVADDIANISRTASPYYDFGKEVEQILLQGKVSVGEGGEVDFAPSRAGGKSFSFQLSSSAVKTLSSLIIYLKYQAKPNELLIIDEPELNLHPDNQILLARVFARMINKGIRLLISTHSDYIIRELNNLIMLSAEEPALKAVAEEFGYSEEEKINREDVGVYLFQFKNPEDKFVTVEELPVADNGFEVPTIDAAIKRLNAASEEIYFTMKYGAGQGNGTD